ncbi:MAG: sigma factor-like helix-turn-helix DNA-binding protein [Aristaeellaceae bacterium]
MEGLTYQQLARREGLSLTQVRARLHRIRKRLRKERDGE